MRGHDTDDAAPDPYDDGAPEPVEPSPQQPRLLTVAEAADMLCVSEATVWELVKRDRLRWVEFVAKGFRRPVRRFRLQDLIRFIEESVA